MYRRLGPQQTPVASRPLPSRGRAANRLGRASGRADPAERTNLFGMGLWGPETKTEVCESSLLLSWVTPSARAKHQTELYTSPAHMKSTCRAPRGRVQSIDHAKPAMRARRLTQAQRASLPSLP